MSPPRESSKSHQNLVEGPKISISGGWGVVLAGTKLSSSVFQAHCCCEAAGLSRYQHFQACGDLFRSCFRQFGPHLYRGGGGLHGAGSAGGCSCVPHLGEAGQG